MTSRMLLDEVGRADRLLVQPEAALLGEQLRVPRLVVALALGEAPGERLELLVRRPGRPARS